MSEQGKPQAYLPLVEKYVVDSFSKGGKLTTRGMHSLKTKDWLIKIFPDADEAMQIAAVAHDIDSAFVEYKFYSSFKDPEYLEKHQTGAAETLENFMVSIGADNKLVAKVKHLVVKHEIGGDDEQNLIKDADSLGFFDRDLLEFIKRHSREGTDKGALLEKVEWMYDRITSPKAREFAKPMYDEALKYLEEV